MGVDLAILLLVLLWGAHPVILLYDLSLHCKVINLAKDEAGPGFCHPVILLLLPAAGAAGEAGVHQSVQQMVSITRCKPGWWQGSQVPSPGWAHSVNNQMLTQQLKTKQVWHVQCF